MKIMKISDIPVGSYMIDNVFSHRGFVRENDGVYITVYSETSNINVGYRLHHIFSINEDPHSAILVPRNWKREG